ncbi:MULTISPECIES: hypothetical protein [Pseudonocardia]|uniref:Uncharacterized protein n=2 Tax=Pseudonocardia TaxID=1847 RepID=A0A1Y2MI65_PSEAH|nr:MULTISPECIES: hypothetical protein [Pseudonocardia]OSY34950.1 hypothetical protein BG845_06405 [Pseudonocardia autotrophica]TDN72543.1 hypothetical protein C8E95_1600 [Pseudonocardia autotrophica]BBG03252.1 hypothetical protein Pdca_44610 [Pseudonocardia autotrophica]GEC24510.1 hypothetical protein PSA01_15390 [Pseudonocardia saturnea]
MRPDTPISEADPADALEQRRPVLPDDDDIPVVPGTDREADPADLADQLRDAGQDEDSY